MASTEEEKDKPQTPETPAPPKKEARLKKFVRYAANTWRAVKFGALATAATAIVLFGRDAYIYFKGVDTEYCVTGDLLRNLPIGEYATREIAFRVKTTAKNELATLERDTLFHIKTGFDMSAVTVERLPDGSIRIKLPPVKLLSMEEIRGPGKTVSKSLFASMANIADPAFPADSEYAELLRQSAEQKLFDPALSTESLETIYKPILQETAGPGVSISFVLPAERPPAEVYKEYFATR